MEKTARGRRGGKTDSLEQKQHSRVAVVGGGMAGLATAYFLGRAGIITHRTLSKGRRYAIVGILLVAGAITPSPDVFSQLMLAGPLYFLYELSIVLVRYTGLRQPEEDESRKKADRTETSPAG